MSRRRSRKQLTTHVSTELAAEVTDLAVSRGVSISAAVEVLIAEALRANVEHNHASLLEAAVERTIRHCLWSHVERLGDLAARAALYGDEGRRMTFQVLVNALAGSRPRLPARDPQRGLSAPAGTPRTAGARREQRVAGRTDTVVKARYSRGGKAALKLAKDHLRYAIHRANDHGQRQYREVWDRAGQLDKAAAYEQLDRVKPEDHIYRFTLSPHPERQDAGQHLDLRNWTRDMLSQLEREAGQRVEWFAVTHEHRDHRHVHAVVVSGRHLNLGHFQAMREVGDANARGQQRQLQQQHPVARQSGRGLARDRELLSARRAARASQASR